MYEYLVLINVYSSVEFLILIPTKVTQRHEGMINVRRKIVVIRYYIKNVE